MVCVNSYINTTQTIHTYIHKCTCQWIDAYSYTWLCFWKINAEESISKCANLDSNRKAGRGFATLWSTLNGICWCQSLNLQCVPFILCLLHSFFPWFFETHKPWLSFLPSFLPFSGEYLFGPNNKFLWKPKSNTFFGGFCIT